MGPFERIGACGTCGREYTVSGAALAPGAETEAPARFFCTCGGFVETFLPGSVNRERVVLLPRDGVGAAGQTDQPEEVASFVGPRNARTPVPLSATARRPRGRRS